MTHPDAAFDTHTWIDVDGEARCEHCMTAPDWALAEQPCSYTGPRKMRMSDEREAEALRMYVAGMKTAEICRALTMGTSTLARIVTRAGVSRYGAHAPTPHLTASQVLGAVRLRAAGRTWAEVSIALGRSDKTIRDAVRKLERGEGRVAEALRRRVG